MERITIAAAAATILSNSYDLGAKLEGLYHEKCPASKECRTFSHDVKACHSTWQIFQPFLADARSLLTEECLRTITNICNGTTTILRNIIRFVHPFVNNVRSARKLFGQKLSFRERNKQIAKFFQQYDFTLSRSQLLLGNSTLQLILTVINYARTDIDTRSATNVSNACAYMIVEHNRALSEIRQKELRDGLARRLEVQASRWLEGPPLPEVFPLNGQRVDAFQQLAYRWIISRPYQPSNGRPSSSTHEHQDPQLAERIAALEFQNEQRARHIAGLETANEQYAVEVAALETRITLLKTENQQRARQNEALQTQNDQYTRQNATLTRQINKVRQDCSNLADDLRKERLKSQRLTQERDKAQKLASNASRYRKERDQAKKVYDTTLQEKVNAERQASANEAQLIRARKENEKYDRDLADMTAARNTAQMENDLLKDKINSFMPPPHPAESRSSSRRPRSRHPPTAYNSTWRHRRGSSSGQSSDTLFPSDNDERYQRY